MGVVSRDFGFNSIINWFSLIKGLCGALFLFYEHSVFYPFSISFIKSVNPDKKQRLNVRINISLTSNLKLLIYCKSNLAY